MASTPHRATYLLSVWREGEGEPWRAALQPADGGPRAGFGDLEQLAAFLLRLQDELAREATNHRDHGKEGDSSSTRRDRPTTSAPDRAQESTDRRRGRRKQEERRMRDQQ